MTWWNRNDVKDIDAVSGCLILVRRKAIEEVGMMDDRFFMYSEETDWCYSFKKTNWEVLFTPATEIIQLCGQSAKKSTAIMIV